MVFFPQPTNFTFFSHCRGAVWWFWVKAKKISINNFPNEYCYSLSTNSSTGKVMQNCAALHCSHKQADEFPAFWCPWTLKLKTRTQSSKETWSNHLRKYYRWSLFVHAAPVLSAPFHTQKSLLFSSFSYQLPHKDRKWSILLKYSAFHPNRHGI